MYSSPSCYQEDKRGRLCSGNRLGLAMFVATVTVTTALRASIDFVVSSIGVSASKRERERERERKREREKERERQRDRDFTRWIFCKCSGF